jgi:hypothetical protein
MSARAPGVAGPSGRHRQRDAKLAAAVASGSAALSLLPRILFSADLLQRPWRFFGWSDIALLWRDTQAGGHQLPFIDLYFPYPPIAGVISGLISLTIDDQTLFVLGWGVVAVLAAGIGGYLLAQTCGLRRALLCWSCAPQVLLLSGANFDVVPAVMLLSGVVAARKGKHTRAAVLYALGTATKLFPAVVAPLGPLADLRRGRMRRALATATAFVGVVAIAYLPTLVAPRSSLPFVGAYATIGSNEESVWGLVAIGFASNGGDASGVLLAISSLGFALTYFLLVVPRSVRNSDPAVGAAYALVALLLWTRLYSPPFSIWLLPFFALLALRWRTLVLFAAADVAVFFTSYPLLLARTRDDPLPTLLIGALMVSILIRYAALFLTWRDIGRGATRGLRSPSMSDSHLQPMISGR